MTEYTLDTGESGDEDSEFDFETWSTKIGNAHQHQDPIVRAKKLCVKCSKITLQGLADRVEYPLGTWRSISREANRCVLCLCIFEAIEFFAKDLSPEIVIFAPLNDSLGLRPQNDAPKLSLYSRDSTGTGKEIRKNHEIYVLRESKHFRTVTLSHCWGGDVANKLIKTNLNKRLSGFRANTLAQTFQDALQIAHDLGFKFIWIDALCILQDSVEEWAK
jgi:hypothetical protein